MLKHFPGKQQDEQVVMVIRKHLLIYVKTFLIFIFASALPLALFLLPWSGAHPIANLDGIGLIGYLGACLYLLYSLLFLMITILNDEFDLFILTDHRLIDITQVSFLQRTVSTTPLSQIQDTTSDVQGLLGTIFNYGTVSVQTASGIASTFNLDHVHDPGMVARLIMNQAEERREKDLAIHGPPVRPK